MMYNNYDKDRYLGRYKEKPETKEHTPNDTIDMCEKLLYNRADGS